MPVLDLHKTVPGFSRVSDPVSRMFRISMTRWPVLVASTLIHPVGAQPAHAQAQGGRDAAVTAAARALAVDGVKLAQADRCGEAIDKLQRAEQLHHSPIVLSRLGECLV